MSKPRRIDVVCKATSHADTSAKVLRFQWLASGSPGSGEGYWAPRAIAGRRPLGQPLARGEDIVEERQVTIRDDRPISVEEALLTPGGYYFKWILRCDLCGLDVQATNQRMEPYLDGLWRAGVSEVDLGALARILQ